MVSICRCGVLFIERTHYNRHVVLEFGLRPLLKKPRIKLVPHTKKVRKGKQMMEIKKYFDIQLVSSIHTCAKIIMTDSNTLVFVFAIYERGTGRVFAKRQFAVDAYNGKLGLFLEENSVFTIRFDDIEVSLYRCDDSALISIKSPMIEAKVKIAGLSVGYF